MNLNILSYYIIPSNKTLVANDGVLELSDRPEKGGNVRHLPIDLFFTSLAQIMVRMQLVLFFLVMVPMEHWD